MPRVCIQAGHQHIEFNIDPLLRSGTGAPGEVSFTVDIANQVSAALRSRGFEVLQTDANANSDPKVTSVDWDLFLAIHYDADTYNDSGGFVAAPDPSVDDVNMTSNKLRDAIATIYFPTTGITNHPERQNPNTKFYYMWSALSSKTPCVLIECGVGWRVPKDSDVLNSTIGRPKVVEGIVRGICVAFGVAYDIPNPSIPTLPVVPPATPSYPDLRPLVAQIRAIVYGSGWLWTKVSKLKQLLP